MSVQLYTGLPQRVIDDTTLFPRSELEGNGLIPRDYDTHPVGYFCPPMEAMEGMVLYPEDEWVDRINEKWANESWPLHHIKRGKFGKPCPNYYQNGWGFCWYYSTAHAMTGIRTMMGLPYVALSPFAAAYLLRGGKNQGGWGGESAEDCMNNGIPEDEVAPNLKTPVRNTPELQASRARHKLQEIYMDLQAAKYDRKMSRKQYVSAMLQNCVCINDYPFWSHSVCATALKADSAGNIESVIWNSHDPNGNDTGDGVLLKGSKAWPEGGCIAVRAATMAA